MFEVKKRFVVWPDDFATEQFFAKRVDVIILTAFADQAKKSGGLFRFPTL